MKKLIAPLLIMGSMSVSHVQANCRPEIQDAWLRPAPANVPMAAGYFRIRNACAVPKNLRAVTTKAYRSAMIHQTVEVDGVAKMRHLPTLTVAKGDRAEFKPGGLHVMFIQPAKPLKTGQKIPVTLSGDGWFRTVDFTVRGH